MLPWVTQEMQEKEKKKKSHFTYQRDVKGGTEKWPHKKISEFFSYSTRSDKTDNRGQIFYIYKYIFPSGSLTSTSDSNTFSRGNSEWTISNAKRQTPNNPVKNSCTIFPRV